MEENISKKYGLDGMGISYHIHNGVDSPQISPGDLSGVRVSGARAYRNTTVQAITTDTWTKVQLNAETFDRRNEFDSTTNYRFTTLTAGYYSVSGALKYDSVALDLPIHIAFYKNGAVYSQIRNFAGVAGEAQSVSLADIIYLNVGEYLELYTYHYMGGPTKNILFGSDITFMSIYRFIY